jgi:WD40 repeat protein
MPVGATPIVWAIMGDVRILNGRYSSWSRMKTPLQTLEGHRDWVSAIAFSYDGQLLAPASGDKTVRLQEPVTGAALQTLEGHQDSVRAIAFSQDGKQLASVSVDRTVKAIGPGRWEQSCRRSRATGTRSGPSHSHATVKKTDVCIR